MATKSFTRIDCGYRCAPNYEGYGWLIEADDYAEEGFPKYFVDIPEDIGSVLESKAYFGYVSGEKFYVEKVGHQYTLGFRLLRDAKAWCIANAR